MRPIKLGRSTTPHSARRKTVGKFWVTINGKRKRTAAGVRHEYDKFQSSKKAIRARDSRNKARRQAIAAGKAHVGDGTAVHHRDSNPMDDKASNLVVESARKNAGTREDSRLKGSYRNKKRWGK